MSRAGSVLLDRIRRSYKRYAFHVLRDTPIIGAELGNDAEKIPLGFTGRDVLSRERILKAITYTEEHYMEQISLDDMASLLDLQKGISAVFLRRIWECRLEDI